MSKYPAIKHWPFEVINELGMPEIKKPMRGEVDDAAITVLVCFNEYQCQVMIDTAKILSTNVLRLTNKSMAPTIAHSLFKRVVRWCNVFVFCLGCGILNMFFLSTGVAASMGSEDMALDWRITLSGSPSMSVRKKHESGESHWEDGMQPKLMSGVQGINNSA
ncbi:Heat shock protein cognate 2 [Echinococcus granulosus]|uniref:Heat shock protein cognate 2 n=1 Tax=Echinococcus granulosus TaxID=6210 RepID=W6U6I1_ECHGR|nr:Heat shock protein cognate 2 [Echinococcus granulosus]EUB56848.1 Heat shock protein cognate 2 [Echinococcus granulosus]